LKTEREGSGWGLAGKKIVKTCKKKVARAARYVSIQKRSRKMWKLSHKTT